MVADALGNRNVGGPVTRTTSSHNPMIAATANAVNAAFVAVLLP
jgi:hypothetical protein